MMDYSSDAGGVSNQPCNESPLIERCQCNALQRLTVPFRWIAAANEAFYRRVRTSLVLFADESNCDNVGMCLSWINECR